MPEPDPSEVRRVREVLAYGDADNPFVRVFYDDVAWPDGRTGRYNRIVEGDGRAGVAVLPLVGHDVDGAEIGIGLVLVDRYPVGRRLWEVPRGFGEADPETDARRELREETGWAAERIVPLGRVYPNSGLLAGHVELFAAYVGAGRGARDQEAAEVRVFGLDEISAMVRSGELADALSLAAVLRATTLGLIRVPVDPGPEKNFR